MAPKSRIDVKPGSVIILHEAGGGGFGDPKRRSVALIERDIKAGLVSERYVRKQYPDQFERGRAIEAPSS